jgi:nuclease HARBI1
VGNDLSLGISQSSTSRSIHEVCAAVTARLAPRYITFPQTQQHRNNVKQRLVPLFTLFPISLRVINVFTYSTFFNDCRFFEATGFPGVIGALDCTYISIVRPTEHEEAYINRKGNPTINVQAVSAIILL